LMIFIWSRNVNDKINDPFIYKGNSNTEVNNSLEDASAKDTDGDGLSDSDELDIYETSPYLEDSDSDGVSDSNEVKNGTNPNCAFGADCEGEVSEIINPDAEEINQESFLGIDSELEGVSQENFIEVIRSSFVEAGYPKEEIDKISDEELYSLYLEYSASQENQENISGSDDVEDLDAQTIREAYISAGYSEEEIDGLSDEELIKAYREALKNYQAN